MGTKARLKPLAVAAAVEAPRSVGGRIAGTVAIPRDPKKEYLAFHMRHMEAEIHRALRIRAARKRISLEACVNEVVGVGLAALAAKGERND